MFAFKGLFNIKMTANSIYKYDIDYDDKDCIERELDDIDGIVEIDGYYNYEVVCVPSGSTDSEILKDLNRIMNEVHEVLRKYNALKES